MKILDITEFEPQLNYTLDSFWSADLQVLGNGQSDIYKHNHIWHDTCVEWRIAEYNMDPNDLDAVLHLILHEHLLLKRDEITCYTSGYTPEQALAVRLLQIQEQIDYHTSRMTREHARLVKHQPHKHPMLNSIRELGVREEVLQPRRLMIEGIQAKRQGRKGYASDKIAEAHGIIIAEGQGRKGPWHQMRMQLQQDLPTE